MSVTECTVRSARGVYLLGHEVHLAAFLALHSLGLERRLGVAGALRFEAAGPLERLLSAATAAAKAFAAATAALGLATTAEALGTIEALAALAVEALHACHRPSPLSPHHRRKNEWSSPSVLGGVHNPRRSPTFKAWTSSFFQLGRVAHTTLRGDVAAGQERHSLGNRGLAQAGARERGCQRESAARSRVCRR